MPKTLCILYRTAFYDQAALLALFTTREDAELKPFLDLFSENTEWIEKICQNYKTKRETLASGNQIDWQSIIQEESAQLAELETQQ